MSLGECMAKHTQRQYLTWMARFQDQANELAQKMSGSRHATVAAPNNPLETWARRLGVEIPKNGR